jgi:uncharacterized repeat protein (TIGR03803 family)
MNKSSCSYLLVLALSFGIAPAQPPRPSAGVGKLSLLATFGDSRPAYGEPGQLLEVSPGVFVGLAQTGALGATMFQLTSTGALSTIYTFPGKAYPQTYPLQATDGRIYGVENGSPTFTPALSALTLGGTLQTYPPLQGDPPLLTVALPDGSMYGAFAAYSLPNIFERFTIGGVGTILHTFATQEGIPHDPPIHASDGNFYGISQINGVSSAMVYRLTPKGDLTVMATYPDGTSTSRLNEYTETLLQASNGKLYGTAALGGSQQSGAIFELSLDGTFKTLLQFPNQAEGWPTDLIQASDGNLYGTAGQYYVGGLNYLYQVTPAGAFQVLHYFDSADLGTCPPCWLTQGSDGKIYGTMLYGSGMGIAFTWDNGLPKPQPAVGGAYPSSGAIGASVVIYGENLLGPTAVSFNGVPATFQSVSKQFISATVPTGATSGNITVTTMNGTAASRRPFTVE